MRHSKAQRRCQSLFFFGFLLSRNSAGHGWWLMLKERVVGSYLELPLDQAPWRTSWRLAQPRGILTRLSSAQVPEEHQGGEKGVDDGKR